MNEIDRQTRATLQTLVALQGTKILQLERENATLKAQVAAAKKREELLHGKTDKQEAQA